MVSTPMVSCAPMEEDVIPAVSAKPTPSRKPKKQEATPPRHPAAIPVPSPSQWLSAGADVQMSSPGAASSSSPPPLPVPTQTAIMTAEPPVLRHLRDSLQAATDQDAEMMGDARLADWATVDSGAADMEDLVGAPYPAGVNMDPTLLAEKMQQLEDEAERFQQAMLDKEKTALGELVNATGMNVWRYTDDDLWQTWGLLPSEGGIGKLTGRKRVALLQIHPDKLMGQKKDDGTPLWSHAALAYAGDLTAFINRKYTQACKAWARDAVLYADEDKYGEKTNWQEVSPESQMKITYLGGLDYLVANTSDLRYVAYKEKGRLDGDGVEITDWVTLPPNDARGFIKKFQSTRTGANRVRFPDLLTEYFGDDWNGNKIGIVLALFNRDIAKSISTDLHDIRASGKHVTLQIYQFADAWPADWEAIERYWRTLLVGTDLDDYLVAKEFFEPGMNAWLTINKSTMCYKKKVMALTYSTDRPPQIPDDLHFNLNSLNWSPWGSGKRLFTVDHPFDRTPEVRWAMEDVERMCGGRTRKQTIRSFGTARDDRRTRLTFAFHEDDMDDVQALEQVQPMIDSVNSLGIPGCYCGFQNLFTYPPYSLLAEANKTNKWAKQPHLYDFVLTAVTISKAKLIVVLKDGRDPHDFAVALERWSQGQEEADRVRSVRDGMGNRQHDARSNRPTLTGLAAAATSALALTDDSEEKWWWLRMELIGIPVEEREAVGNYVLENIRRDLIAAGYSIPRSEPRLVLQKPGGEPEYHMPVMFSEPHAARAAYVRFGDQLIDHGDGDSFTLRLWNQRFRELTALPGTWDRILDAHSIAPSVLANILPAIEDAPSHPDGRPMDAGTGSSAP